MLAIKMNQTGTFIEDDRLYINIKNKEE